MAEKKKTGKDNGQERTYIKGLGFCGNGIDGNLTEVDVKDGKIIRIKPFRYTRKYKAEWFKPWKLEARGKNYEQPLKTLTPHLGREYKKRV